MHRSRASLARAYRATAYRVGVADGEVILRIGQPSPGLQALVAQQRAPGATLITAWTPQSRRRPESRNQAAGRRLADELAARAAVLLPYRAVADAGCWPAEAGLLVIGPGLAQMRHLARRYSQNAIVWLPAGGPARLIFL